MTEGKSKRDMIWEMKKKQREEKMLGGNAASDFSNPIQNTKPADIFYREPQEQNMGYQQPQQSFKENSYSMQQPQQNDIFSNITNTKGASQSFNQPDSRAMSRPPVHQPFASIMGGNRPDIPNSRENFMQQKDPSIYSEQSNSRQARRSLGDVDYQSTAYSGGQNTISYPTRENSFPEQNNQMGGYMPRQASVESLRPGQSYSAGAPVNDYYAQQKALEKQKKQELAEFLRMQMNEKAKNANPNEDRKAKLVAQMENQQFDYFGRSAGGGGAPLRDIHGDIVATRKPRMDMPNNQNYQNQNYQMDYPPQQQQQFKQNFPTNDMLIGRKISTPYDNMAVGPSSGSNYPAYQSQPQPQQLGQGTLFPIPNSQPTQNPFQYNAQATLDPGRNTYSANASDNGNRSQSRSSQNNYDYSNKQGGPMPSSANGLPYQQDRNIVAVDNRVISKRVTVEEPTHAEMERKEKQKNEMQRALLEQIEAKKRQKEEEERRRKQEELEEEMRIRRENEEIEKKLEAERQQQKKKAQLFDNPNQEHVVASKVKRNRNKRLIDDDGPPYNTQKPTNQQQQQQQQQPENNENAFDNANNEKPAMEQRAHRRRPRPDLFGDDSNGAPSTNPKQDFQKMLDAATGNTNQPQSNYSNPMATQTRMPNAIPSDFVRANMNAEINQIRNEIQNQQAILSKQLESIKNEAVSAMEERNRAERELKELREQLRQKVIQEDGYRDNLRKALEKNSELKMKQLSEKIRQEQYDTNTRIPGLDLGYNNQPIRADPSAYVQKREFNLDEGRNYPIITNQQERNEGLKGGTAGDVYFHTSEQNGGGKKKPTMFNDSELFGDAHNQTLIADTKMIPLETFDKRNIGASNLTMSKLNHFNIRPTSSQNTKAEGDILDKFVSAADESRPSSQNHERMTGMKAGVNYYNMNREPQWIRNEDMRPDSSSSNTHATFVNPRAYGDTLGKAGKDVISGGGTFKGDMSYVGIGIEGGLYNLPDEGTGKFNFKGDDTMDLNSKRDNRNANDIDLNKILDTSYGGALNSSLNIEKIHEMNEARLRQLENVKFENVSSKWTGRANGNQSRGNYNYLNTPMKKIDEDDELGKVDQLLGTYGTYGGKSNPYGDEIEL